MWGISSMSDYFLQKVSGNSVFQLWTVVNTTVCFVGTAAWSGEWSDKIR